MADTLKLYVIASRVFVARLRLDSIVTDDKLSAEHERQSIRRDMIDFCKGQGDSAPIPESLFCSLTELCRRIHVGGIFASNIDHAHPNEETSDEAKWTNIKEHLSIQGGQGVDFENYRETICQFICCYMQRELVVPNLSPTSQASNAPPTPAPTSEPSHAEVSATDAPPAPPPSPEPSHAEVSAAPTPRLNMTARAWMEGYDS